MKHNAPSGLPGSNREAATAQSAPDKMASPGPTGPSSPYEQTATAPLLSRGGQIFVPPFILSLAIVLRLQERPASWQRLAAGLPGGQTPPTAQECLNAAAHIGIRGRILRKNSLESIPVPTLPCILLLRTTAGEPQQSCVLVSLNKQKGEASVIFPENDPTPTMVPWDKLEKLYTGETVFIPFETKTDRRVSDMQLVQPRHWFWDALLHYLPIYRDVALGSLVINLLTLASPLFIMNVYDRVVPNSAIYTLWVLAIGLVLAHGMDFMLRSLRNYYLDVVGRNVDVIIASRLMQRVLHMRLDSKPESTGGLVSNLREFDQVREFFGSSSLMALFDLPFLLLFICMIAYIGGPIVFLVIIGLPLLLLFIFLIQTPFQRSTERQFKQNMQKNSLLVEIVNGLETVKSTQAQGHMRHVWEGVVDASAKESGYTRRLGGLISSGSMFITAIINAAVVVWGVYRIASGDMTQGGLIACVILVSRSMGPLMHLASMLTQLEKSKMALRALHIIMDLPVEEPADAAVDISGIPTRLQCAHVHFTYPHSVKKALHDISFTINPGERVGFIGRAGSGKSTLARLLTGLYQPSEGATMFGGVDIRQVDPADLRARIGFMPQDNYLFYGSVRENIAFGCPWVGMERIVEAAEISGVADFVQQHPLGYELPVGERGQALSGGQRQAVALARTLVRSPDVLILDEPSSNLDMAAEHALMLRLRQLLQSKTLLIMTHRPSLLALVDRIIVLDEGRIVADGPREAVLDALRNGQVKKDRE